MPRLARAVFSNVPHHVVQRGNRQEDVFFCGEDYLRYLEWLYLYSRKYHLEILAYCLMTNHVHLIVVPESKNSLHLAMKPLHMRYAQHVNKLKNWKGHIWQGRYFSAPLDDRYMWAAIRYVELNPVRAGMVDIAEDYAWSSAPGHCGLCEDNILSTDQIWKQTVSQVDDWSTWLSGGENSDEIKKIRRNINKGLPCGSREFTSKLEKIVGRPLSFRPRGRPSGLSG
jgi:putative transposase